MTLSVAVIDALVAAGATVEQLAAAVKADLAEGEARAAQRRQNDAARQAKSRANRKGSMSRNVTVTSRDECDAPPNDIYSNPPVSPDDAKASCPPLIFRVVEAWNAGPAARGATAAKPLDAGRRKALTLRVREHGEEAVFAAIANLAVSAFHCGENDRGWRANIGWLLKSPENFQKAIEMAPAPAAGAPRGAPAPRADFEALCDKEIERFRAQGNEREARAWERRKRGEDPRNGAPDPPRTGGNIHPISDLLPMMRAQA